MLYIISMQHGCDWIRCRDRCAVRIDVNRLGLLGLLGLECLRGKKSIWSIWYFLIHSDVAQSDLLWPNNITLCYLLSKLPKLLKTPAAWPSGAVSYLTPISPPPSSTSHPFPCPHRFYFLCLAWGLLRLLKLFTALHSMCRAGTKHREHPTPSHPPQRWTST